jgi:hypothetical protein
VRRFKYYSFAGTGIFIYNSMDCSAESCNNGEKIEMTVSVNLSNIEKSS